MNSSRFTTLLSITLGAILLTGVIVPILSQQAFAQASPQDDFVTPPWVRGADTSFFVDLTDERFRSDANPTCAGTIPSGIFTVQNQIIGPSFWAFDLMPVGPNNGVDFTPTGATVTIGNFIDPLLLKTFQIQHTYCPIPGVTPITTPAVGSIECDDSTGFFGGTFVSSQGPFTAPGNPIDPLQTPGSTFISEAWTCQPNPDREDIILTFDTTEWALIQVVVDTQSTIMEPMTGGTFEGVNTAALLVAGAQANALWLIPLITAIGVGIIIVKRKSFF